MSQPQKFILSGVALPHDAETMLDEICEHFVEHSTVERTTNFVRLTSDIGLAAIRLQDGRLLIDLTCPTEQALQLSCNTIAEHLFYFAGDEPFELTWSTPAAPARLPDLREVTVVSAEDVTPHMRRVIVSCDDVTPFVNGGMHVRILVPPRGRVPVWPTLLPDGRTGWPEGDDELVVRVYTIRAVDNERRELWLDFVQHPAPGVRTPGADFARDAKSGDRLALLGPGGGGIPQAATILMAGDESALPAMARIAAEVPANTRIRAIIEVADATEEQPMPSGGTLEIRWLHRKTYPKGTDKGFSEAVKDAIASMDEDTYVWVACEKDQMRSIRGLLTQRGHDRKRMYAAWYWQKEPA
jgi:NADPH-dependent ferric siderophore reductase